MKIANEARFLFRENKVVALSRQAGTWMRLTKECYDILMQAIEMALTREKLISSMYDEEDRIYFGNLLSKLYEIGVLTDGNTPHKADLTDVSIILTKRCNLKCTHCIVDAKAEDFIDHLNTEQLKEVIDKVKAADPRNITLTGGEPMVRKDFMEILEHTYHKFNGKITLMTNGTLINPANVGAIVKMVSNINISIDGVDEASCSLVRGKGVFNKVIRTVRLLQQNGFNKISLSMVLTKNNANVVTQFHELCEELGTKPMLRALSLEGRAKQNKELLTEVQLHEDNKELTKFVESKTRVFGCSCCAGVEECTIETNGDIFPCNLFVNKEFKMGNIQEVHSLSAILPIENNGCAHSCLHRYEPEKNEQCKNCDVNLFCWSCLHDLYQFEANPEAFKNRCAYMKRELGELVWSS
ncbi:GTP 3',8-cyclase [Paenibacillus sp. JJ-100]|uniref:radical SAM/SPASM domain-containing protein n=1 Tax=Paenibacillus sp. JJ-100 TaxID=2974896 RepID=UPI0022FF6237|nr:radical SAM protein [Paenibacillus sp. JJ-100]CAI6081467.1 GTP 3',8-cyclase [Paenibacillus sp. JJ-100]